jgi:hypothetical protein
MPVLGPEKHYFSRWSDPAPEDDRRTTGKRLLRGSLSAIIVDN